MKNFLKPLVLIVLLIAGMSAVTVYRIRDIQGDKPGNKTLWEELIDRYTKAQADTTFVKVANLVTPTEFDTLNITAKATAPTKDAGTNTTDVATTGFVYTATGGMFKSGDSLYFTNGIYKVSLAVAHRSLGSSFLSGLIGYWKFDEASGTATDATGSNNLTVYGAVQNVTGKLSKAISFSGTTDRVGYLDILKPTAAVSISAWVKTTATGNRAIAGNQHWTNNGYALMVVDGYPRMAVYSSVQTPTSITAYSNTAINDGNWHYVVGTFDGTNAKTYVDGSLTNTSGAWAHAITYDSRSRFVIGQKSYSDGSDYPWNGILDEVGIHNRALSLSEIQAVYNSAAGKPYPFFP